MHEGVEEGQRRVGAGSGRREAKVHLLDDRLAPKHGPAPVRSHVGLERQLHLTRPHFLLSIDIGVKMIRQSLEMIGLGVDNRQLCFYSLCLVERPFHSGRRD